MASIPCAAYKASNVHQQMRRENYRQRRLSSASVDSDCSTSKPVAITSDAVVPATVSATTSNMSVATPSTTSQALALSSATTSQRANSRYFNFKASMPASANRLTTDPGNPVDIPEPAGISSEDFGRRCEKQATWSMFMFC